MVSVSRTCRIDPWIRQGPGTGTQLVVKGLAAPSRQGRSAREDERVPIEQTAPVELAAALARFDQLWSPRIVTQVNDYDVRVAKVAGDHVWHAHDNTDEFFLVVEGELRIALRDDAEDSQRERTVVLPAGAVFVVPRGTEHRPSAPAGASILMFEPTGTSTVGDRHDPVPGHVDATTGHLLA
jgi:mannose-6-phosphate isomerase-like protein (cupin superfamily)